MNVKVRDSGERRQRGPRVLQDARGDQCDKCTNMLNPTDLINPRCKETGTRPVLRSTRHFFLDLPQLSPPLQEWIDATSAAGGWSSNGLQVLPVNRIEKKGSSPRAACPSKGKGILQVTPVS